MIRRHPFELFKYGIATSSKRTERCNRHNNLQKRWPKKHVRNIDEYHYFPPLEKSLPGSFKIISRSSPKRLLPKSQCGFHVSCGYNRQDFLGKANAREMYGIIENIFPFFYDLEKPFIVFYFERFYVESSSLFLDVLTTLSFSFKQCITISGCVD